LCDQATSQATQSAAAATTTTTVGLSVVAPELIRHHGQQHVEPTQISAPLRLGLMQLFIHSVREKRPVAFLL